MIIAGSVLGLILVTFALSRLKPAVPSVDRSTVWIDTVKRGPMVRQVRGLGTLVPRADSLDRRRTPKVAWKKSSSGPARRLKPDTVILELTSPELEQTAQRRGIEGKGGRSGTDHLARDAAT